MGYPKPRPPIAGIAVKKGADGLGLFATAPIKKGAFIVEYWGEVISEEESNRRGGLYLFELDSGKIIDGKSRKNIARYANHSCINRNAEPEEDRGRVFILAKRNIKPGEEIMYDYGKEYWIDYIKPKGCKCGCKNKGPKRW